MQNNEATPLVLENDEKVGNGEKKYDELRYGIEALGAVLRPVFVTMSLSASLVAWTRPKSHVALVYQEDDDDITVVTKDRVEKGAANALAIVGVILLTTCCVVGLYWCGCTSCLRGYMMFSSATLLGILGGGLFATVLVKAEIHLDVFTLFIIIINWAAVGVAAIYSPFKFGLPRSATRAYLISAAVVLAWHLSTYPPVTTWCALIGLALYDLFAVLAPCGPLNALVQLMATRREPLPGLLYEAQIDTDEYIDETDRISSQADSRQTHGNIDNIEDNIPIQYHHRNSKSNDDSDDLDTNNKRDPVKLGLGDFVFFSVLVANDAKQQGFVPAAAATLACLIGLATTLILLTFSKRALPALPISIALGVTASFFADACLLPMLSLFVHSGLRV